MNWQIEVGNEAKVTELIEYSGSRLGAVRAGHKRWRKRTSEETSLVVRRPGCQPALLLVPEKAIGRGGKRSGSGRKPARGEPASCRVTVLLTTSERDELRVIEEKSGEGASAVIRRLVVAEAARILFGGPE